MNKSHDQVYELLRDAWYMQQELGQSKNSFSYILENCHFASVDLYEMKAFTLNYFILIKY